MKRYILFMGQTFYPSGGIYDKFGRFETVKEAQKAFQEYQKEAKNIWNIEYDWAHIYDVVDNIKVWEV